MVHQYVATILSVLIGSTLLATFYYAVKTEWPASYVAWENDYGILVNRSLIRYALFRVAPVYLVSVLVTSAGNEFGASATVSSLLIGLASAIPNLMHLWRTSRAKTSQSKVAVAVLDIGVGFAIIAFGFLGGLGLPATVAANVLPGVSEFFASFWTTAFVAILAASVLHLSRRRTSMSRLVRRSIRETADFTTRLETECLAQGADFIVARAIMLTENLERPAWVRKLETLKRGNGSYGVMQVQASAPIDDFESIRQGVIRLAGVPTKLSPSSYEYIEHFLTSYNSNPEFRELGRQVYWELKSLDPPPIRARSDAVQQLLPLIANFDGQGVADFVANASVDDVDQLSEVLSKIGRYRNMSSPPSP